MGMNIKFTPLTITQVEVDMKILLTVLLIFASLIASPTRAEFKQACPDANIDFDVIDMHAHTFNLRYLPVKGILYSRGVPKPLPRIIDRIVVSMTGDFRDRVNLDVKATNNSQRILDDGTAKDMFDDLAVRIQATDQLYQKLSKHQDELEDYIVEEIERELARAGSVNNTVKTLDANKRIGEDSRANTPLTEYYLQFDSEISKSAPRSLSARTSIQDISAIVKSHSLPSQLVSILQMGLNLPGTIKGVLKTLTILMLPEDVMLRYLMQREFCEVDVFIQLMMDLEKTYNDSPDFLFEEQLDRSSELMNQSDGKLLFFGAFDPFRGNKAMELVEDAVAAGAVGIKFYPPNGYRPSQTDIPTLDQSLWEKIVAFFTGGSKIKKQWNSRYKGRSASEINVLNDKFFTYMEKNNLIIFSHHSREGFEARGGYGMIFGKPGYWAKVLNQHPSLKLVIGHSGGGEGWFGTFEESLSLQAYNLCVLYENVYCDFGFSNEVLDKQTRTVFQSNLRRLIESDKAEGDEAEQWREKPLHCLNTGQAPWVYPITDKMLYGSDWMMVSRIDKQRQFVEAFEKVFTDDLLVYRDQFFAGNARKLLYDSQSRPSFTQPPAQGLPEKCEP